MDDREILKDGISALLKVGMRKSDIRMLLATARRVEPQVLADVISESKPS